MQILFLSYPANCKVYSWYSQVRVNSTAIFINPEQMLVRREGRNAQSSEAGEAFKILIQKGNLDWVLNVKSNFDKLR